MIARAGVFALACLGPWLAPMTASAQGPAAVATEWGLAGSWAIACDRPPGPDNVYSRYEARPDGDVSATADDGSGKSSGRNVIVKASIRPDGVLTMVLSHAPIRLPDDEVWFMKGPDGRRRMLLGRSTAGVRSWVAEGKVVDTGRETSWETRCR